MNDYVGCIIKPQSSKYVNWSENVDRGGDWSKVISYGFRENDWKRQIRIGIGMENGIKKKMCNVDL